MQTPSNIEWTYMEWDEFEREMAINEIASGIANELYTSDFFGLTPEQQKSVITEAEKRFNDLSPEEQENAKRGATAHYFERQESTIESMEQTVREAITRFEGRESAIESMKQTVTRCLGSHEGHSNINANEGHDDQSIISRFFQFLKKIFGFNEIPGLNKISGDDRRRLAELLQSHPDREAQQNKGMNPTEIDDYLPLP